MAHRNFLILVFCAVLVCCNRRSESKVEEQGKKLLKEDSIALRDMSNKISELIMSGTGSISLDSNIQQEIEMLLDSALSIDENDFLTNYNYFLYTGVMSNYVERLNPSRKLYMITQNPIYLNAMLHAFMKLDRKDSINALIVRTDKIIESNIEEHPEDLEMRINKLTFLCLTSSDKDVMEYFESLKSDFKGDATIEGLYNQYQEVGCSIFVPK